MNMRKKKERSNSSSDDLERDGLEELRKWKEERVRRIQEVLSSRVRRLKLCEKCLLQLLEYGFASPEYAERDFHRRLKEYKRSGALAQYKRDQEDGYEVYSSYPMLEYEKILDEVVEVCLAPLKSLDRPFGELEDTFCVSEKFQKLKGQIISKTNPKEPNVENLTEAQKEWLSTYGCGIETIEDVFYMMESEYLGACHRQYKRKYSLINQWLKDNHSKLYEFYLHGTRRTKGAKSFFPSMGNRLKTLDKFMQSEEADPVTIEIAIRQLKHLIEDDLLFACVFYSYFFKSERGRPPDLKRMALNRVTPYVYYLKFFDIQPIQWSGTEISSIYDLGVLLLNALADEKIFYEHKGDGHRGILAGANALYVELDGFLQAWRSMVK
jgi:hypothetical protein